MYKNNIVNFQESTPILNACKKKSGNLLKAPRVYVFSVYINRYSFVNISTICQFGLSRQPLQNVFFLYLYKTIYAFL